MRTAKPCIKSRSQRPRVKQGSILLSHSFSQIKSQQPNLESSAGRESRAGGVCCRGHGIPRAAGAKSLVPAALQEATVFDWEMQEGGADPAAQGGSMGSGRSSCFSRTHQSAFLRLIEGSSGVTGNDDTTAYSPYNR